MDTTTYTPAFLNVQSVINCLGFRTADDKYRALVSISEKDNWPLDWALTAKPVCFRSTAMLSKMETEVFEIEAADIAPLYWAYRRYEDMLDGESGTFTEFADQERVDHAAFFREYRDWSFDLAVGFMVSVCGLPLGKCMGWVSKIVAMRVREGRYDPY